jgi:uroporphyrin-III C-methyltransferase
MKLLKNDVMESPQTSPRLDSGVKSKKVYLVGAGSGDPDLLTIKAAKVLQLADVLLFDRLVSEDVLEYVSKSCIRIFVGKECDYHTVPQEEINRLLVEYGKSHTVVVRLKGGDPFIFGRGGEEIQALEEAGLEWEVVPGITTALGAAAALGIPLTHRGYSSQLILMTGHKQKDQTVSEFHEMNLLNKTLVIYMGLNRLVSIVTDLLHSNNSKDTPVAIIQNATLSNQKVVTGTLETIVEKYNREKLVSPCLIIIGEVVGLRK